MAAGAGQGGGWQANKGGPLGKEAQIWLAVGAQLVQHQGESVKEAWPLMITCEGGRDFG